LRVGAEYGHVGLSESFWRRRERGMCANMLRISARTVAQSSVIPTPLGAFARQASAAEIASFLARLAAFDAPNLA
jgi:hypothetical protein